MRSFKSCMTACAAKSNFAKWKKILYSLATLLPLCILTNSVVLSAGAIDPADWVILDDTMTLSILGTGGNNIDAYYLASDDSYKPITFHPINTNLNLGASNVDGYAINYWTTRECIVYQCSVPSDIKYGQNSAKQYMIPFGKHFSNVDFFEWGIASVNNVGQIYQDYLSSAYTLWSPYNSIQAGDDISDVYPLGPRSNSQNGAIVHVEQWDYPFCCFTYESSEKGDFWLGDCYLYPMYSGAYYDFFVVPNIRINSGYQYLGSGDFPGPVVTTTAPAGAGSMQGGIVSDSTGYTVAITNELPGYMYTGTYSDISDNLGEAVTSIAEEAGEAAESAASAVGGLAAYDSGILWYILERLFLNHPEVIAIISGLGAISLFGFVLNRYGR